VTSLRARLGTVAALLIAGNLLAWVWAFLQFRDYPVLLGTAFLAYSLGLRHAVDADHIAAIDNVMRKLMQEGRRPVAVGFFFSLGHSTVVILAAILIALATTFLQSRFAAFREVGGVIGTGISAFFLFLVAIANLFVMRAVYRVFRRVRKGGALVEEDVNLLTTQGGLLTRLFRPLFRLIGHSWQMYPLGFLFGLGFDTATQIGVLGLASAETAKGLPVWSIMVFPALFTAGMSLVDTADSVLMLGAYGWAFVKPVRKLYYNLTITFVSVMVALLVGGIEALGILAAALDLTGPVRGMIGTLNDNLGSLGYVIIAIFALSWLVSMTIYRLKRFDEIEVLR